jgi:hypothetical protein
MGLNTLSTQNWHWLSGSADPSPYTGRINDFYLNTTTNKVFKKTGYHVWSFVGLWAVGSPSPGGSVSINFSTSDWNGGNSILVIASGTPGSGQIGPHNIPAGNVLYTKVQLKSGSEYTEVFLDTEYDSVTNTILITKTSNYPVFDGAILVSYGS